MKLDVAKSGVDGVPNIGPNLQGIRIVNQARVANQIGDAAPKELWRCIGSLARNVPEGDLDSGKAKGPLRPKEQKIQGNQ